VFEEAVAGGCGRQTKRAKRSRISNRLREAGKDGLAGKQRRRPMITSAAEKQQISNNIYSGHSPTQRANAEILEILGKKYIAQ